MDKDLILRYMPDYYNGVYEMEELLKAQGAALASLMMQGNVPYLINTLLRLTKKVLRYLKINTISRRNQVTH